MEMETMRERAREREREKWQKSMFTLIRLIASWSHSINKFGINFHCQRIDWRMQALNSFVTFSHLTLNSQQARDMLWLLPGLFAVSQTQYTLCVYTLYTRDAIAKLIQLVCVLHAQNFIVYA